MAKLNGNQLHINTVKKILEEIEKDEVVYLDIYYKLVARHHKEVAIRTNWEYYYFKLNWNEFRKIILHLNRLNGEEIKYEKTKKIENFIYYEVQHNSNYK